jgi:hypothetical protein
MAKKKSQQAWIKDLREALVDMMDNADEDTPHEYRTKHFNVAMADGRALVKELDGR